MFSLDNNAMNSQDRRNLFVFIAVAAILYLAYDAFILKPQIAKIKEQQSILAYEAGKDAPKLEEKAKALEFVSREEALKQSGTRIAIENAELQGTLSLRGAVLDDMALKNYMQTLNGDDNVALLSPKGSAHARFFKFGWVSENNALRMPDADSLWQVRGNQTLSPSQPVKLFWDNGQGLIFERQYDIDENYLITVTQNVINNSAQAVTLFPYGLVSQTGTELSQQQSWLQHEGPMGWIGEQLYEIGYDDLRDDGAQDYRASQGWIGISDKYWLASLMPAQGQPTTFRFAHSNPLPRQMIETVEGDYNRYQTDFTGPALSIAPGTSGGATSHLFIGAKRVLVLEEYEAQLSVPQFNLAVNFGWFWFLSKPFFYALHYLGELVGNFGIAIILLTILIRSAVFPLTNTSYRSFAKMKKVTPKVTELREKYGDDKQKLQQELIKMYGEEGVNPMAGCFPILLQIPIFFALYKVLFVTIEMRHAPFFGWIEDLSAPDPTSIFNLFGLIPWDPPSFLNIGVWPCLMLAIMMVQRKLNPPPQDPIQRDMALYFPFIMTFIMAKFAAGLVVYWTFSALISVLQQMIIMRSLNVPIYIFGQYPDEKKLDKQVEDGPAVHPLADMAEEEVEEALFDHEEEPKKEIKPPKRKRSKKKK